MPRSPLIEDLPCTWEPERFFSESPEILEDARSLCHPCPLKVSCLQGAIERKERRGVWGGQIIHDGVVQAKARRVGRPKGTANQRVRDMGPS